jgi:uncharacterized membrane protein YebE (DUF533 family)
MKAPGLRRRRHIQNHRAAQGVKSGEIDKSERQNLRKSRRATRRHVAAAKADGNVSGAERKALHRDMNRTSHLLYAYKHN